MDNGPDVDTMSGCMEELRQPEGASGTFSSVGKRKDRRASWAERFRENDLD